MQRRLVRDAGWHGYRSSFTGSSQLFSRHGLCTGQPLHKRSLSGPSVPVPHRFCLSGLNGLHLRHATSIYGGRNASHCHYSTASRTRFRHIVVKVARSAEAKETPTKGTVEKPKEVKPEPIPTVIITTDDDATLNSNTFYGRVLRIRKWVMDGIHHYWDGSKLLAKNIKSSVALVKKLTEGQNLSRRERAELINTAIDIFRLVPFAVFVIVPFMEFLLPFALKLFPNMLPSTFQDKLKKEEDMKRQLKLKLTMASFLQDALNQMSQRLDDRTAEFLKFMDRVQHGQPVTKEELTKYSNIFSENFTLMNASQQRPLLISMCKFLGLNAYGTNSFLRWQIRMKLGRIRQDDKLIQHEGIKSLTFEELQQACIDRGMIGTGLSKAALRNQMQDWLNLSLTTDEEKMPVLLLSRALVKEIQELEVEPEKIKEEDKTLLEVADAVTQLSSDALQKEREELEKLKVDLKKIETKIEKEVVVEEKKAKTTKRLEAKLEGLLKELEKDLLQVEQEVGDKMNLIDRDKDGVITTEEIAAAIELLRDKPSETEIVDVLKKLDLDQDGKIALADVEKVLKEALIKRAQERKEATASSSP